ncbi:MAG: S41 family peptidase [Longimicrobiales bacterium]|nr:S41 family peptidase [Longimicrobiales bacterium]
MARWRWRCARIGPAALATVLVVGCFEPFLGPEPGSDPGALFDLYWSQIDAYYSYFAFKPELDWDSVRAEYQPRVVPGMDDRELADVLGAMITELRDGHADLVTPFGEYGFDPFAGQPSGRDPGVTRAYLTDRASFAGGVYEVGRLTERIGYVHISTMSQNGSGPVMDDVLSHLAGVEAIVVDVRDNLGGTDLVSEPMAARFYDARRAYRRVQYRDGPEHDDFTEPRTDYLEPAGRDPFTGPVALLTNVRTYSAAEGFVTALRVLPHALTVGDTTGGGAGNPIWRELPNGWAYRVPRWVVFTADGLQYEGVGLPPDVPVGDAEAGWALGTDAILERAVAELQPCLNGDAACRL